MTSANHRVMIRKDMVSKVSNIIKISVSQRITFYILALYIIKYQLFIIHRVTELFHKQNYPQFVQALDEVHSSEFLKDTAFYYDCNAFPLSLKNQDTVQNIFCYGKSLCQKNEE